MQPVNTATANPAEDIDAVVGRFQAWSALRRTADKTHHRSSDLPDGVRELSYEEALETSRQRWQAHRHPVENRTQRAASNKTASASCSAPAEDSFDDQVLPDKVSLTSAASSPEPGNPSEGRAPAFDAALAEALPAEPDAAALALIWPAPQRNERQVSMSLRVGLSEQALIKARAAEAGLSVSAYLRQCALEVEKLRAQVHHTLARLEQGSEYKPAHSLPAEALPKSFLARLGRRLFGNPARLSLRA